MVQQPLKIKVIGIPHIPSVTEINARPDAGTNGDIIFKIPVGTTDIMVIDVKEDIEKKHHEGKVYQWFQAQFAEGVAWVRDDLVEIQGDGTTAGYGVINVWTHAFSLTRQATALPQGAEMQSSPPAAAESDAQPMNGFVSAAEAAVAQPADDVSVESIDPVVTEPEPVPVSSEPAMAQAMTMFAAKIRSGPGTGNEKIAEMNTGDTAQVIDEPAQSDQGGNGLFWVKVNYKGQSGWTREDLVRLSGNFSPFGLNAPDKYPCPVPQSTWVRGWDTDGSIWRTGNHHGWDHAGQVGAPLLAGPQGGVVFTKEFCRKCGDAGRNVSDRSSWGDPGWNFGYGHYVIVGYENSKLPASTLAYLDSEGRAGQHIFVMYAHCQQLMVETGDTLAPDQQIATLGNSGFSTGAHLHLEVRISDTMSPERWAVLEGGRRSPGILFLR